MPNKFIGLDSLIKLILSYCALNSGTLLMHAESFDVIYGGFAYAGNASNINKLYPYTSAFDFESKASGGDLQKLTTYKKAN